MCGSVAFGQGFLFNQFIMKYLLEDVNKDGSITLSLEDGFLMVECRFEHPETNDVAVIYLGFDKDQVFQLNGVLHHLQKQMK